jgi:perosamine synthetase
MDNSKLIPMMVPDIRLEDIEAVNGVLRSGMLIQGEKVEQLENNIAYYLGMKHAIAVSNGTATLHLALVALGIGKGDEVIVPAFSYMATANVVEIVGAKPVFVDIDINTFNIDVNNIEAAISSKTKAIIPVHEFGLACDINEVCEIAEKYSLMVIEDAACALGATDHGKFVGSFGTVGSFSFHPRKAITSGEGGMLVTNDDALAKRLRILRNHGIEMQDGKMEFVEAGFNYRLTDFQAALVDSQFKRMKANLVYKASLANVYLESLSKNKCIQTPAMPANKSHTWQSFHIILKDRSDRDSIISELKCKGIGTNYGAQCIPVQKYYLDKYQLDCEKLFPNALTAYKQGLVLPLYEKMSKQDILIVSDTVNEITR